MKTQAGMENKAAAAPIENKDAAPVRVRMTRGVLAGKTILVVASLAATLVRDGAAEYGETEFREEAK